MKKILRNILPFFVLAVTTTWSQANVIASLTSPSVSISTGQSFVLTLSLISTTEQFQGLSYFLTVSSGATNSVFTITGRTNTGSVFSDFNQTNGAVLNATSALLDPNNNTDLGATIADPSSPPLAGGHYTVADLTITNTSFATPGIYTISLFNATASYGDLFNPTEVPITASYNITVVPEPSSYAMMGVGLLIFGGVFLKRQSAKN